MNIEEVRNYCLQKPFVSEAFPFDETTLVFKVDTKMFALTSLDKGSTMNLKCNPERAIELRENYSAIIPGFHMNKKHWNTVDFEQLESAITKELIDHSYTLVFKSLTKKVQAELINQFPELQDL